MTFRQQTDLRKIKEFLDMVDNVKVDIRRFKDPVLVWAVKDGTAYYSFWEQDIISRFGLENVDGWDFEEDILFCPDWVDEALDEWDEDADDDDDDNLDLSVFRKIDKE